MPRCADKIFVSKGSIVLIGLLGLFFFSACSVPVDGEVDRLNMMSYASHYRNLDTVRVFASRALAMSGGYPSGRAEAYNNLAFADIAKMDYDKAYARLDSVEKSTDNQVELLVADVQYMRLCQRESKNKSFYGYRERALRRMKRIDEEKDALTERMRRRYVYAKTEFQIVCSTYFYYVGLIRQSSDAMRQISPSGEIQGDTAQYLNFLYQIGSGGIISSGKQQAVWQKEFECLLKCYVMARQCGMTYWQANSLQAISEHLLDANAFKYLKTNNKAAFVYLNTDNMPDSLMAGYFAQKALDMFKEYGDVYQTAGAYRTLSRCYFMLGDYTSSLICLENAMTTDKAIEKAPAQIASIKECMSLVYSALNDKNNSDINRNAYLDIQEETRQDRQLEARVEQLEKISIQQNLLIVAILVLIMVVVTLLLFFNKKGKKRYSSEYISRLLVPLSDWEADNKKKIAKLEERFEEVNEELSVNKLQLEKSKRQSLDNKAKAFLIDNVLPYIDRIINEVNRLKAGKDPYPVREERFAYMSEIINKISEYNTVLTHWISLQQGQLSLHIESFNLHDVFSVLSKSEVSFNMKGIRLDVENVDVVVKADRILTLFMLNTLADNARKFTPCGGTVAVSAVNTESYVEISVKDTGIGLSQEELSGIFDHKVYNGHGFGLMNCRGIMEKYRKVSRVFSECGLFAESEKGKGSRFYFRLPYGVARSVLLFLAIGTCMYARSDGSLNNSEQYGLLRKAGIYADSAYFSNVNGNYERTLVYADSARLYLNEHYLRMFPNGKNLMVDCGASMDIPAEITWFRKRVNMDYGIVLDIRNESAVAALALHRWGLYAYNNKIYTQLFKECSADKGLVDYCKAVQVASTNKLIAIIVLVFLLVVIVVAYYFLYYRHVLYFRLCVENIYKVNEILLSKIADEEKLGRIDRIDTQKYPDTLKRVIEKIKSELKLSVASGKSRKQAIETVEDELHKVAYEKDKLYICNSVTDNSLSALKHETMYYPSRIQYLLFDKKESNVAAISDIASYYKELYSILCEQVRKQIDSVVFECKPVSLKDLLGIDERVLGDKVLVEYLFEVLQKQCGCVYSSMGSALADTRYVVLEFVCRGMKLTEAQCQELFSPSVKNIPFFICRQILREIGEQTNLHGCGISVHPCNEGISVDLTFARAQII